MTAAIKTLEQCESPAFGRKFAVLSDMGELGEQAVKLHRELGSVLDNANVDQLFVVGKYMKDLADIVVNQYPRINVNYFNDKKALERALLNDVNDGDIIMIKGSNTFKMSTTVKMLQKLNVYQDKKTISR